MPNSFQEAPFFLTATLCSGVDACIKYEIQRKIPVQNLIFFDLNVA